MRWHVVVAYVLAVLGVLIASAVVDDGVFGATEAWFYDTLLTIGYLVRLPARWRRPPVPCVVPR